MWPFTKRSKGEVALVGLPVHVGTPRGRQAVHRNVARVARLKDALRDAAGDRALALEAEIKRREG